MDPFDLRGQIAVVTGSSKGIGKSIAEHLAQAGARVVVSSRKAEACALTAESIRKKGGDAHAIPCHVGDQSQLQDLVDQTRKKLGRISILVCNAASNPYFGPIADISEEAYQKTQDTNVFSALRLCSLAMPDMVELGGGAMILISSIGALKGSSGLTAYGISKAALSQMVRSLAVEWGQHNIRVNGILPGLVKTDFARALWDDPEKEQQATARYPLKRLGVPDDIGPAAVFLASRAAAWLTGQNLVIDGGITISG